MNMIKRVIKIAAIATAVICCITVLPGCAPLQTSPTDTPEQENISYPKYSVDLSMMTMGGNHLGDIELSANLPELPETLPVYKFIQPDITEEYVKELGTKLGLNGNPKSNDERITVEDDTNRYTVDKATGIVTYIAPGYLTVEKATGTIHYEVSGSKLYPHEPPVFPSNDEIEKTVMSFLADKGMLPEGDTISGIEAGGGGPGCGECCHLLVSFNHAVPIAGPGAKHGVRIGDGGEIIQVFINPTNPLELPIAETLPVKPVAEALEEIIANGSYEMLYPSKTAKKVQIDDIRIVYWLEGISIVQEYIVPVYVFLGKYFDDEGNLLKNGFVGYTEAIKTE